MEILCPICNVPVVEHTSDIIDGILRFESYQCVQPTHDYHYEFKAGGACERIKTDQMTVMVRSHYTDTLDLVREQQAILKHAIQLAKNTTERRG